MGDSGVRGKSRTCIRFTRQRVFAQVSGGSKIRAVLRTAAQRWLRSPLAPNTDVYMMSLLKPGSALYRRTE
jgi:hypothetical protein